MLVSGFTIARNAIKFNYPILESIRSVLPICDEFIVNVGDSEDDTLGLIRSIGSAKIRIIQNVWDLSQGSEVLSQQTNLALKECTGDWAFYLQSDEVIHEEDLARLKDIMHKYLPNGEIDALRFRWLHFFGSYFRYRIDHGWYQKQDRIIRNNGKIESFGDAYGFRRKDGRPIKRKNTGCFLYHYGWVQSEEIMTQRRVNAEQIGFTTLASHERQKAYHFGDLNRFPVYFGTHPAVMREKAKQHVLSQKDLIDINERYWWHPLKWLKLRYKTGKRVKQKIE
ncbi:MAG: glycosyltransferase family 2 protein [Candidatus Omnitrophica bacterium]|nr:glycosyltransferase family 2 protein [Candidatus Omnitrophota bacterium]